MNKNEIIKSIYYDPAGFSGIKKTYNDAKEKYNNDDYNFISSYRSYTWQNCHKYL